MTAPLGDGSTGTVRWVALGGTLQAVGHDAFDLHSYHLTGKSLSPEEVMAPVADLLGDVRPEVWGTAPSHHLGLDDVLALLAHVRAVAERDRPSGIVVTCGSNGLEEIAYLLWLLYPGPVPVVVTAAMRPPTAVGSDALDNLGASVAVARSAEAGTSSVLVVSDGAVLHPAAVHKGHTSRVDSFSRSAPALGRATAAGEARLRLPVAPSPVAGVPVPSALPRVEIVTSCLGADGAAIRAAVAAGGRAVVSAGMGAGFTTPGERDALREAACDGVVVCQSRRTPAGRVLPAEPWLLVSNRLTPQKARLALAVGLAVGADRAGLQDLLDAPR
ncbi:asparaginase domain-containing protein [Streptomyces radicis]|uniref:Asparaginase n=1 Tax=Streptomyces radicis TaxID=1750517 RepID=A0A3A9WIK4_9ACTN|nr:asparaginase domain-containing protein [Streptomyces radicis]RKN12805.1 hypothetical protein D7319_02410 [Streptomyces radicis]RKN27430.1 hypothetical protein D7318_00485 [Streptomyces radicis]